MRRAWAALGLAIAAAVTPASLATAATRTSTTPNCMSSYVDMNNDGICNAGDLPLAPLVADGYFSANLAEPGYTPPGHPVSVVLHNFSAGAKGLYVLAPGGSIRVEGTFFAPTTIVSLIAPAVDIADHADFRTNAGALLGASSDAASSVRIGARAQLSGGENVVSVTAHLIEVGERVRSKGISLSGDVVHIGAHSAFNAGTYGSVSIVSKTDLALTSFQATGYTIFLATTDAPNETRHITLTKSQIRGLAYNPLISIEINGAISPAGNVEPLNAADAIVFDHSRITAPATATRLISPTPTITP